MSQRDMKTALKILIPIVHLVIYLKLVIVIPIPCINEKTHIEPQSLELWSCMVICSSEVIVIFSNLKLRSNLYIEN